jgi:peptidoglycan/xylan/chitin deacetylase (PgdA/CDA1 family)
MSDKNGSTGIINGLTMVCYHYVRELNKSAYPAIHGLEYQAFKEQLDLLLREYEPVTVMDVAAAVKGKSMLPEKGLLLTFDDGYLDHYTYVLPELMSRKLSGLFFVPVEVTKRRQVLDVNKIHFIIAAAENVSDVVDELCAAIEKNEKEFSLLSVNEYREQWALTGRYDDAETMFIKRMFQRGLPEPVKSRILTDLFQRFVCPEEGVFATELYMNSEQVQTMKACGMSIGCHGVSHRWFTDLSKTELQNELDESWAFLESLGEHKGEAAICYPYGGYSNEVINVVRKNNFAFGVTVESAVAMIGKDDGLLLPRLDTNDIPDI